MPGFDDDTESGDIRTVLMTMSSRFTQDDALRSRIVDRSVMIAAQSLSLDTPEPRRELMLIVRRIALDELKLSR